jgi:hypothetical protein
MQATKRESSHEKEGLKFNFNYFRAHLQRETEKEEPTNQMLMTGNVIFVAISILQGVKDVIDARRIKVSA